MNSMNDLMNPATKVGLTVNALIVLFLATTLILSTTEHSMKIWGEILGNGRS